MYKYCIPFTHTIARAHVRPFKANKTGEPKSQPIYKYIAPNCCPNCYHHMHTCLCTRTHKRLCTHVASHATMKSITTPEQNYCFSSKHHPSAGPELFDMSFEQNLSAEVLFDENTMNSAHWRGTVVNILVQLDGCTSRVLHGVGSTT